MASKGLKIVGDEVHGESSDTLSIVEIVPLDGVYNYIVSTEFTINLGDYNSKKVGGSVGGQFSSSLDAIDVGNHLMDKLYESINDELNLVKDINKGNKKSFIHNIVTN